MPDNIYNWIANFLSYPIVYVVWYIQLCDLINFSILHATKIINIDSRRHFAGTWCR